MGISKFECPAIDAPALRDRRFWTLSEPPPMIMYLYTVQPVPEPTASCTATGSLFWDRHHYR
jgi:hypothetical protein